MQPIDDLYRFRMDSNRVSVCFNCDSVLLGFNRRVTNSTTIGGLIRRVLLNLFFFRKNKTSVSSTGSSTSIEETWREPIIFKKSGDIGHRFFSQDIAEVSREYDDNAFYDDLDKLDKIDIPPDYELVEVEWTSLEESTSETD